MKCPAGCLLCYENVKGRSSHKGHRGYHAKKKKESVSLSRFMKPTKPADGQPPRSLLWQDSEFQATLPALSEFLGDPTYADGSKRDTGTLLIFCDGTAIKGCLTDRDTSQVAFFTADSWAGLLETIETKLASGEVDWRVKKEYKPNKR
jgi:hypothetical protein